VRSKLGGILRLRTYEPVAITNAPAIPATGSNPNSFYAIVDAGKPLVTNPATLPTVKLRAAHTVDFATVAGGVYVITPTP
jgi:hypothetical protein